jgi:hypothetical protein
MEEWLCASSRLEGRSPKMEGSWVAAKPEEAILWNHHWLCLNLIEWCDCLTTLLQLARHPSPHHWQDL